MILRSFSRVFNKTEQTHGKRLDRIKAAQSLCVETNLEVFSVANEFCILEFAENGLDTACTCRVARSGKGCRHLWAAVKQLEQSGAFEALISWADSFRVCPFFGELSNNVKDPAIRSRLDLPLERITPTSRVVFLLRKKDLRGLRGGITYGLQSQSNKGRWGGITATGNRRQAEKFATRAEMSLIWDLSKWDHTRTSSADTRPIYQSGQLRSLNFPDILTRLSATGRFFLAQKNNELIPINYEKEQLKLWIRFEHVQDGVKPRVRFVGEKHTIESRDALLFPNGVLYLQGTFHRSSHSSEGLLELIESCLPGEILTIRRYTDLLNMCSGDEVKEILQDNLHLELEHKTAEPKPVLSLKEHGIWIASQRMRGDVTFDYDGKKFKYGSKQGASVSLQKSSLQIRNRAREDEWMQALLAFSCVAKDSLTGSYVVQTPQLLKLLPILVEQGWRIESMGQKLQTQAKWRFSVRSSIDWFDLSAELQLGNETIRLPKVLERLQKGETFIQLKRGAIAILPHEWVKKRKVLLESAEIADGKLRFARSQVGMLNALLDDAEEMDLDKAFAKIRSGLSDLDSLRSRAVPTSLQGNLRAYQQEGFAWLDYLRQAGFGGCLADDMGLGKTVQVLAHLEDIRASRGRKRRIPSLIVVPRSLLFNWQQEAAKFTPQLKILIYHGANRKQDEFKKHDVILTTYGTLRNDVLNLGGVKFDYCILDEAQAIKNARSKVAKAVRVLQACHRLIVTGTPIENHLGELWSLFEFLNPGMLGKNSAFQSLVGGKQVELGEDQKLMLSRALRPFMLRRTKEQVATDLPQKTEMTIFCDIQGEHRRQYDELRDYYRQRLLGKIEEDGLGKSKIHILEALLRLRQCACHPGLVNDELISLKSDKLNVLFEQLQEIVEEGHKALVFSQFTSLLSIVRTELNERGMSYEYLDGRTHNRQERVERFQEDSDCPLFLISLKAGGVGLNLTAADYVFILDPWWNPAAEAQAIDRAHRIGQTKSVFAYRIISRDTVEEKVLLLQQKKRELADAIMSGGNSALQELNADDLEALLS